MVRLLLRLLTARQLPGGLAVALICAAMSVAGGTEAATLIVTSTADSGAGSLRDAIAGASDGDTILFDTALNGQTIGLTSAELVIDKNITISGPGRSMLAVSRVSGTLRIFHVLPGHTVVIERLKISGGFSPESGGGVLNDQATLTLNRCAVEANYSGGSGGGGLCNFGVTAILNILNSTVYGNLNSGLGFGTGGEGAGINSNGMLTITNSSVSGNSVTAFPPNPGRGGGIFSAGPLEIVNSTISGNTGGFVGGGLLTSGSTTIANSTISGNTSIGFGGGISNGGSLTISNSTISGNTAVFKDGGSGGGIYSGSSATVTITSSTVSGNRADFHGGGIDLVSGTLQIANTILNSGTQGVNIYSDSGTVISQGYNLSNDNGSGFLTATGDLINTEPMLGSLQNNGGPTFTHELLTGSPAIDTGNPSFTPPPLNDQRGPGYARVFNGRIDIGSLEVQPAPTPTPALGYYPNTPVALSGDTTVTPDATPANTTSINVSTSTDFKGTLAGEPTTGVVHVTDAHPAGTYAVTVRAFGPEGMATRTFTLTVTSGISCGAGFTFTSNVSVGGANPKSVAIGDFNGDGHQDLAVANGQSSPPTLTVSIRLGTGLGGFSGSTQVSVGSNPVSVAIGDFNGDGKQDFAVANNGISTVSIRLGDGLGGFGGSTEVGVGNFPTSVAIGDFNGDGKQDLAVVNSSPSTVSIRLGDGLGGFSGLTEISVGSGPRSVAIGDFNGDGKEDLAIAISVSNTVSIRLGDGLGGFSGSTEISVGSNPVSVAIGDFNGDGKQDLAVATSSSQSISIRLGDGLGGFSGSAQIGVGIFGGTPSQVAIGDFNGDGKQDFAASTTGPGSQVPATVSIALGDGIGGFSSTEIIAGYFLSSVTIGDFNGDSKQDLAVTNLSSGTVSLFQGQCLPTPTPTATPSPTLTPTPTPTPTPTATPSPSPARALNISTRMLVQTGDRVGIGGFIITGSAPKQVLVRGLGPSLAQFGVPDVLADPVLELHGPLGFPTIINNNWRDTQIPCTDLPPTNDLESAICATLDPGAYSAIIRGNNDTSGVGLVEVYDLGPAASQLANISTRAFVSTGANVMIGGFILGEGTNSQIAIFGIGPSLAASGVSGVLADPTLELRDSDGALMASNDDCGVISIRPLEPKEACLEVSLPPGLFSAIVAGKNGGTGVGLVEIYNLQ